MRVFSPKQESLPPRGVTSEKLADLRARNETVHDYQRIIELLHLRGLSHDTFRLPPYPTKDPKDPIGRKLLSTHIDFFAWGAEHNVYFDRSTDKVFKLPGTIPRYYSPPPTHETFEAEDGSEYSVLITDLDKVVFGLEKALGLRVAARRFGFKHLDPWVSANGVYVEDPLEHDVHVRGPDFLYQRKFTLEPFELLKLIGLKCRYCFFEIDTYPFKDAAYLPLNCEKDSLTPDSLRNTILTVIDGLRIGALPDKAVITDEAVKQEYDLMISLIDEELNLLLDRFDKETYEVTWV
jgi:hypothetical protein